MVALVVVKKEERDHRDGRAPAKDEDGHDSDASSDTRERRRHRGRSPEPDVRKTPAGWPSTGQSSGGKGRARGARQDVLRGPVGAATNASRSLAAPRQAVNLELRKASGRLSGRSIGRGRGVNLGAAQRSGPAIGSGQGTHLGAAPARNSSATAGYTPSAARVPPTMSHRTNLSGGPVGAAPGMFEKLNDRKHLMGLSSEATRPLDDSRSSKRKAATTPVGQMPPPDKKLRLDRFSVRTQSETSGKRTPLKNPSSLLESSSQSSSHRSRNPLRLSTQTSKRGGKQLLSPVGSAVGAVQSSGNRNSKVPLRAVGQQKRSRVVLRPRSEKQTPVWRRVVVRSLDPD